MTGPQDPDQPDWGFPDVEPPDPASTRLPEPEPEAEVVHDTGSDAWWRAQARAQREAAASDSAVPPAAPASGSPASGSEPPPETVEPQVLNAPPPVPPAAASGPGTSPLDPGWEPDLSALRPGGPAAGPPAPPSPPVPPAAPAPAPPVPPAPPAQPPTPPAAPAPPPPVPPTAPPLPPVDRPAPAVPRATPPPPPPPAAAPPLPYDADVTDPHGIPPVAGYGPLPGYHEDLDESATEAYRPAAPLEHERVRPARALAGALLAVAGVAVAIGAFLWLGDDEPKGTPTVALPTATSTRTAAPTTAATGRPSPTAVRTTPAVRPTSAAPAPAPAQTAPILPVTVLNNSKVTGLAQRAAARFRAGGWPTPVVGNFRGRVERTTVYYAPGQQASAERFARQFGIGRVAPRFPGLPGSGLTVVLTRDYA